MEGSPTQSAARSRDLLPIGLAVVAAAVSLAHGFGAALTRDLGVYAYGGVTVADGVPPYVGIFNRAGPLAHILPAVGVLAARVTGTDDVLAMRVWFLLLTVAAVPVAYWLARDVFASRLAGVASAVALATFPAVTAYATGGPREKTPMLLFMLLALWAVVHRRWLLSGILTGLATLTLQIALPPLLAVAAIAALWPSERGRRLRGLLGFSVGGAATAGVTVACYAAVGRLDDFLDGFLLANARYTSSGGGALGEWRRVGASLWEGYGGFLPVFLGGIVLLPVLALVLLASSERRSSALAGFLTAAAVGAAAGTAWGARDFDRWPDSYPLLPFAVLGIGGAAWLARDLGGRRVRLAVTAVLVAVAVGAGTTYSVARRSDGLELQRQSLAAALAVLPDARITSIEAPEMLVLADQRNPTKHQMLSAGLSKYIGDTWPGGLRGFARWIRDRPQQLVALGEQRAKWESRLAPRYERVGHAPDVIWYVDTRLDVQVREQLREALREVCHRGACESR